MSQFYIPPTASNVPSDVATSYVTNSGTAVPASNMLNIKGNNTVSPANNGYQAYATGSGNTINITSYGVAKWVVNPVAGLGTSTTIQGAVNQASSGDTIFITPGTYTENVTISKTLNIFSSFDDTGTTNLLGSMTFSGNIVVSISGFRITSNGSPLIVTSGGSQQTIAFLEMDFIISSAVTGISCTNSSASSFLTFTSCTGALTSAGDQLFNQTSPGTMIFEFCDFSGQGSIASTASAGSLQFESCILTTPITTSGSNSLIYVNGNNNTFTDNATLFNIGGSNTNEIYYSFIQSGTSPAISVSSNCNIDFNTIYSSNTDVITGSGTITIGTNDFIGSGKTITATITPAYSSLGLVNGGGTAGQVLTSNGPSSLPTFQNVSPTGNIQVFTSSGTYTPTAGMSCCIIECVGGGGGGGGTATSSGGYDTSAGGGGGGGYARLYATAATIGASQTVTVGAAGSAGSAGDNAGGNGGDSSVGTLCIGKGGTGGSGCTGGAVAAGGAGGIPGTGTLTFAGGAGEDGQYIATGAAALSAAGGNSYFGTGGASKAGTANLTGYAGSLYGGGGGAGVSFNAAGTQAGAAGAKGVVIITEFI